MPGRAPPTLYIIDAFAQFFRAYHAIRTPMTSPVTKEPTNLTFGFVGMLLKLLRGEGKVAAAGGRADYIIVATDASGDHGTFRSQLYPEYKAHRPPPPEDLPRQAQRCLSMLGTVGIPVIGAEGFEADDVIATLVSTLRAEHPELRIRIVSKDKDLKQLLSPEPAPGVGSPDAPTVELYDIHTDAVIDAAALRAESGITPPQVIDMLALMGDNVDNVPGVDGVGPKTAAELVAKYGTLDNLLAHAGDIPGKRGQNIRAAAERLPLSRSLVTLRHDVPIRVELADASFDRLRLAALLPILKECGFNRYQDELRLLLARDPACGSSLAPLPSDPPRSASGPSRGDSGAGTFSVSGGPSSGGPPRSPARRPVARAEAPLPGSLFAAAPSDPNGSDSTGPASLSAAGGDPWQLASDDPAPGGAGVALSAGARDIDIEGAAYRCARTRTDLAELLAELAAAPIISLDTETTGLSPISSRLCGISFSTRPRTGWYVPVRSPQPGTHLPEADVLDALRPILEDPFRPKTGHNLKFDLLMFRAAGVALRGVRFDSMISSFLIDASRSSHSLDALALALLGHTNISIKELIGTGASQRTFDTVDLDLATRYASEDADIALRLHDIMAPQLRAMGLSELFERVELPLLEVLAELEWNGVRVDPDELERQRERLAAQVKVLKDKIDDAAYSTLGRTFNPDSPKQLAAVLFNRPDAVEPGLGLKPLKRTKTGFSTDIEVLEDLAEDPAVTTPIPSLIVEHRQLTKLVSTYLVALRDAINPDTKRIHSSFNQTVAVTGRLASHDPNLQNIPIRTDVGREVRRAFVAPEGWMLVSADYSQIELRLLAHLSQDPNLIEAFHRGEDIHTTVAAQIAGVSPEAVTREQRAGAKMVNFGIVYGITPFGLARRLSISNAAAADVIDQYKRRFPGITTFLEECVHQAKRLGYVETILKRRRPIPDIEAANPSRRALAERTAINSVVQGSAADLIKLAMVRLHHALTPRTAVPADAANPDALPENVERAPAPLLHGRRSAHHSAVLPAGLRMLLQIHDELVFECPAGLAEAARSFIAEHMEGAMTLRVPLKVDSSVSHNWFEGK